MNKRARKETGPKKEHYDEIKRESAQLTKYYQLQELVPDDEWDRLMQCLATGLPTTFRVTGHREEAEKICEKLSQHFAPTLTCTLNPISWYLPAGMAWHLDTERKAVRTDESYREFHSWLVAATENGDISRQEAVSMVPPLLLDVRANYRVLDMCAAPGSKTAQILEYMHADALEQGLNCPSGMLVANDADQQRAYLLHHQVKRLVSPCLIVTNQDGTQFPTLVSRAPSSGEAEQRILFDRILADVPCSGDGTLRKNAILWKTWTPNHALGLHPLQIRLLDRAIRLLKVGGRAVYSTCSMNFVENEAVVAHILARYQGTVELVDVSNELSQLKRRPGRAYWKVLSKDGVEYESFDQVPPDQRRRFPPSLFPRPEYEQMHMDRCLRIYPHLQNTGGFFVAVLHKNADILRAGPGQEQKVAQPEGPEDLENGDQSKQAGTLADKVAAGRDNAQQRGPHGGGKFKFGVPKAEGELRILNPASDPVLNQIFDFYGIDKQAILRAGFGFLVRSERKPIKNILIVSADAHPVFAATVAPLEEEPAPQRLYNRSLKIVNAGVRAFEIYESSRQIGADCPYRLLTESLHTLLPFITKRRYPVATQDLIDLLQSQNSIGLDSLQGISQGGAVLEGPTASGGKMAIPVWLGEKGPKAFVPNANRPALLLTLKN